MQVFGPQKIFSKSDNKMFLFFISVLWSEVMTGENEPDAEEEQPSGKI
jgi:hypothetical protein